MVLKRQKQFRKKQFSKGYWHVIKSEFFTDRRAIKVSFLSLFIYSCTSVSYRSILSDMPSNTLLLIPNEFGTVFELGVQRLQILEKLEIQYSQELTNPERETISHSRLLEHSRSKRLVSHSVCLSSPVSLSLQSPLQKHIFYHNFSPQTNGAHVKVLLQEKGKFPFSKPRDVI